MLDELKHMMSDWTGRFLLLLLVLLVLSIPATIYASIQDQKRWQAFAQAHNCKVVAKEQGHTSTGVGYGVTASGNTGTVVTTTHTPGKTAWLCDDGITYWRSE